MLRWEVNIEVFPKERGLGGRGWGESGREGLNLPPGVVVRDF